MSQVHDPEPWRARFPILQDTTYLVNHSLGAMPAGVAKRLQDYANQWATRGVRSWTEGWWSAPVDVGNVLGKIMNAPENSVVMHQNVSVIQAMVASSLDFSGSRNKVVYTDQNFPSNMYVWEGFKKLGARIEVVQSEGEGIVPTEKLLDAIDESTLIVPISMVCFRNSYLQDVKAICAKAKEVGALVMLDTYQALGTVPLDVQELGVDMVCGGSVKWLCAGPGAGYLYIRPDLMELLHPRITGWAAHAEPFAFEEGAQRYAHGPMGWLHGSPAVPALFAAVEGYETILEVGVQPIRDWSIALNESLSEDLQERGFRIFGPRKPEERGGTLTVALDADENGPAYVRALEARGILIDHRPGAGLRVSPHFYTRKSELEEVAEALAEIRASGAWRELVSSAAGY
ncbi:MAG: aminotransferase class V-fold PLP-dependent enzyme [Planctomycetes bacterium]|nr:aminotransferase class V-fold PLP-dependent enzyme [Planctomycetota bacterium]